jgi:hypothetical protein
MLVRIGAIALAVLMGLTGCADMMMSMTGPRYTVNQNGKTSYNARALLPRDYSGNRDVVAAKLLYKAMERAKEDGFEYVTHLGPYEGSESLVFHTIGIGTGTPMTVTTKPYPSIDYVVHVYGPGDTKPDPVQRVSDELGRLKPLADKKE